MSTFTTRFEDYELRDNEMAKCPHCGHEERDSWELEDGETNCHHCGKPYMVEVVTEITYTTSLPPTPREKRSAERRRLQGMKCTLEALVNARRRDGDADLLRDVDDKIAALDKLDAEEDAAARNERSMP